MTDTARAEMHLARRLARLFRIDRSGGLETRSADVLGRLVERRGAAIDSLIRLDAQRRAERLPATAELTAALQELAGTVARSRHPAELRLGRLAEDLGVRRGARAVSGVRDTGETRLLGRG